MCNTVFNYWGHGWLNELGKKKMQLDYLATHTSLSPIWRGFTPGFVSYRKGCTRLATTSDQVYQLLAHGRWFSPGTPASYTTKTGRHDIAEILLKVALNIKNKIIKSLISGWPITCTGEQVFFMCVLNANYLQAVFFLKIHENFIQQSLKLRGTNYNI